MNNNFRLLPLLMVILIDVMGIVLVLPVLTVLMLQPENNMVPASASPLIRDFLYGFSIALYPLFMFFSTPILGDLSDKFGRKKILMFCLAGTVISYLVSVVGIITNSLFIFLFSRAIAGLAAGTQPIATAAIIDLSTNDSKTKNLSWVAFMCSIGLIIGPILGGLTAEKNIAQWFSFETPFYIAAFVAIFNMLLLQTSYQEQRKQTNHAAIKLTKGFSLFLAAFLQPKFRLLSGLFFCFILAWSLYFQAMNWFLMETFHYTSSQLGYFIGYIGVIFAFTTTIVMRIISRYFRKETASFTLFIFIMALASIGASFSQSELSQWLWVILIAASDVMCYTLALSIFSGEADQDSQGWIMGVTGSLGALTWTIGGIIAGPLGYLNLRLPILIAGMLCLTSFILMLIYKRSHES